MKVIDIQSRVVEGCDTFGVQRLEIFGSVARDEEAEASDIDFLVQFEDESPKGYSKRFFGLQHFLEQQFGCKVDLLTNEQIRNPYLQKAIDRDRKIVYDRLGEEVSFRCP